MAACGSVPASTDAVADTTGAAAGEAVGGGETVEAVSDGVAPPPSTGAGTACADIACCGSGAATCRQPFRTRRTVTPPPSVMRPMGSRIFHGRRPVRAVSPDPQAEAVRVLA